MSNRGQFPSPDTDPGAERVLRGQVGDANIQKKGIGFGQVAHGNAVGKMNAVWSVVTAPPAAGDGAVLDVPHALGAVPVFVLLVGTENPGTPNTQLNVIPWQQSRWTNTNAQVKVKLHVGSVGGTILRFMVGGE